MRTLMGKGDQSWAICLKKGIRMHNGNEEKVMEGVTVGSIVTVEYSDSMKLSVNSGPPIEIFTGLQPGLTFVLGANDRGEIELVDVDN